MANKDLTRNINLYFNLAAQIAREDQSVLDVSLIGALSGNVSEEVWDRCLQAAREHLIRRGKLAAASTEVH